MGKFSRLGNDLYQGGRSIDFVGRKRLWYGISVLLVAVCLAITLGKGLNFGIEFTGGSQFTVTLPSGEADQAKADDLRVAVADSGIEGTGTPTVTTAGNALLVQTEDLTIEEGEQLEGVIIDTVDVSNPEQDISQTEIGASWGAEVGQRAAIGVAIFLALVCVFIALYFREWKMSVAALVALVHDIVITIGIYALSGFPVTPSAVTGLLAILGFSLYDTVVVFDKVRENTQELRRADQSYSDAANLAVNQTLVRSINTGLVALIPIGAILFVSAVLLGASSLQDLALSQFVGMAVGVYSSVCLAPRVLVHIKGTEDDVQAKDARAKARARNNADRYASVPSFADDLPVQERDEEAELYEALGEPMPEEEDERPRAGSASTRPAAPRGTAGSEPMGRGRTAPSPRREVGDSRASGRQQPSRTSKSQRKKP